MEFIKELTELIKQYSLGILTLLMSGFALYISVQNWYKSRNIYDIERFIFFRNSQINGINNNDALKKKLSSGYYTVLHAGKHGNHIELILGKIKN